MYFRNGDFFTAINCIERTLEECKDATTDEAHYVRQMFDIKRARNTVRYFCTHFKTFERHSQCLSGNDDEQIKCAQPSIDHFQTQISATSNMDSHMTFECSLRLDIIECALKVLRKKCSSDAVQLVKNVLEGFEPPICFASNVRGTQRTYFGNEENRSQTIFMNILLILSLTILHWLT
ncbi:hypothetical protein Btru_061868 [Bulinus truncatus]|nr:hypothetical protein Btru_061868 [Bulinus truncatus]